MTLMTTYAWAITGDHIFDPSFDDKDSVGTSGPRGLELSLEELLTSQNLEQFRLKDDDGIVYYTGVFLDRSTSDTPDHAKPDGFEPLDQWGTPNAGCTTIEYLVKGTWQPL